MNLKPHPQSGNALWFILLAVALLGFLTAVISRTGSSVEQSGDVEQSRIKATSLLRYTQSIEAAVQQMLLNGVSESDLDFVGIGPDHDNTNCTIGSCAVFDVAGGGIAYQSPANVLNLSGFGEKWHVSSGNRVSKLGCDDENTSCTELLLLLSDIPKSICLQLNKLQEITNPSGDAPQQNGLLMTPPFTGVFTGTNVNFIGGENAASESPQMRGKSSGCVLETGTHKYVFYQVLLAR